MANLLLLLFSALFLVQVSQSHEDRGSSVNSILNDIFLPAFAHNTSDERPCTMKDCTVFNCFHNLTKCNETHYLMTKSRKLCDKLTSFENLQRFNRNGQTWAHCSNQCQQEYLRNYVERYSPIDCDYLAAALTESAIDCHIACGFCSICKDSRIALLKMLKHRSLSMLKRDLEFRSAIKRCGGPAACALPLT